MNIAEKMQRLIEVNRELEQKLDKETMELVLEACELFADISEAGA